MISLKTKITTPHLEETRDFYQAVCEMDVLDHWDESGDRGVILESRGGSREALLEIYHGEDSCDFSGLSLQFKVEDIDDFVSSLPSHIEFEGPVERPWGSRYAYLTDPNGISIIVYEGGW